MKKLLFLSVFVPFICFGQGDFRKMSWGESVEDLKIAYPEVQFDKGFEDGFDMLTHSGNLIGIETQIVYAFSENKLVAGFYYLDPFDNYKDSKLRLKDYMSISSRLKEKYSMRNEDEWIVTTWKGKPNYLDFAVYQGDVFLIERTEIEDTRIVHSLGKESDGLQHLLVYASYEWVQIMQLEQSDDF